jgi:hypothetical protein
MFTPNTEKERNRETINPETTTKVGRPSGRVNGGRLSVGRSYNVNINKR